MKKSVAKGKHLFALLLETYSPFTGPQSGVPFLLCQALETLIHEYVQTHLYQDAQIAELLEALRHKFDGLLNPAPQPPDADDHLSSDSGSEDQPADEPLQAAGPTPVEELENEFAETDAVELTTEQQAIHDALLQREGGISMVSGMGGSGKTLLMKKLTRSLRKANKTVVLCATTGAAAIRLSKFGMTAHKVFKLPVGSQFLGDLSPTHPSYALLASADVIIVDEMSMLTGMQLNFMVHRLGQVLQYSNEALPMPSVDPDVLRSKHIILVGDHAQVRCRVRYGGTTNS